MLKSINYFCKNKDTFDILVKAIYDIRKEDGEISYGALEIVKKVKDRCLYSAGLKDCKSVVDIFRYVHIIRSINNKWEFIIEDYNVNDITCDFVKDMIKLDIKYKIYLRKKKIENILK